MRPKSLIVVLAGTLTVAAGGWAAESGEESAYGGTPPELRPYQETQAYSWKFFEEPPPYRGPGRDRPAPAGLDAVKIGLIAPIESSYESAIGTAMLRGAVLAVEEANARGGFRTEIPYELVVRNDSGLWGATSNTMVELAYEQGVWGVVGSLDGGNTHIALRAALKAEVPIVNTACTDPTLTETAIPWIVRCYPDDRQHGYRLASLLVRERGFRRIAVLRSNDKYGRMGIREFIDAVRRLGVPVPVEVRHSPGDESFTAQLERIRNVEAEAVVLWTHGADAGRIVAEMRAAGMRQPVFGADRLVTREFLEAAGEAAAGVVATSPLDPDRDDEEWRRFRERFVRHHGEPPDAFAAFTYDGTRLLLASIENAGLNRVLIRDELARVETWKGVTGVMRFDPTHNNLGDLRVLEVREGAFENVGTRRLGAFLPSFRTPPSEVPSAGRFAVGIVTDAGDARSLAALRGAELAVREANAAGGIAGAPVVLEIGETKGAWSTAAEVCRDLVYERGCLGVLSPASGEVAHLLGQVAIRGRVPLLALSSEGSLTRIPDPWLFRVVPDARAAVLALMAELPASRRNGGVPVVIPSGRAGRVAREDLAGVEREAGVVFRPVLEMEGVREGGDLLAGESVILLFLSGEESEEVVELLQRAGWRGTVLMPSGDAPVDPEPTIRILACSVFEPGADAAPVRRFVRAFERAYGEPPGTAAACAYDAVGLLVDAIRSEGPDRAAIRDRIARCRPATAVTGLTGFDGAGNRRGGAHVSGTSPRVGGTTPPPPALATWTTEEERP